MTDRLKFLVCRKCGTIIVVKATSNKSEWVCSECGGECGVFETDLEAFRESEKIVRGKST